MKKTIQMPYVSGLILILILILFSNIITAIQLFFRVLNQFLYSSQLIISIFNLLAIIYFIYLLVIFFTKSIKAYKEKNSFIFYFNHFTASLILLIILLAFLGNIAGFLIYPSYGLLPYGLLPILSLATSAIVFVLVFIFLFNFRKNKADFTISKEKSNKIIKLFSINILASIIAYAITNYISFYFSPLSYKILCSLISILLIIPFYKIWKEIINDEKYNKISIFLSTQIIITNLVLVIISITYMSLVILKIINPI